ncbi:MAG: putative quinol monooxygenase [Melioribacteraceae bacterium]|jgi:quinol monooxygenase YgiN|nr:putative quinol monooxygenase [Melioribacteraceae bacterium]
MLLTIIAKFKLKSDSLDKAKHELLKMVEPTYKEKGCIDYIFYQDLGDPSVLLLYENWESKEDLDAHMNSKHFKDCFATIEGLYELEVHKLTQLA